MAYIGREPQIGNYQVCDAISVVNAQAAYTMQVGSVNVLPESVNHMIVSLNGVIQKPGSSYTISGATITFSRNLVTGETIDFIYLLGNVLDLGTPSDDTVTGAKIVDNAINSEHYTDASIDLAHMSANSIDSNQYVDGSIDTAHIADAQITVAKMAANSIDSDQYVDGSIDTAHIAADQITAAKIADDAISEEHLDVTAVTGHTAETSIADGDLILIHDASASALRKMTKENFVSGIGGVNTPIVFVKLSGAQTIATGTTTLLAFASELLDTDSAFASNYFTVPSGKGGVYQVSLFVRRSNHNVPRYYAEIQSQGGNFVFENAGDAYSNYNTTGGTVLINLSPGNTVKTFVHQTTGSDQDVTNDGTYLAIHRLIQ